MQARIFKPAKSASQSGRAGTLKWVLEFAPSSRREADPLMGWTSSDDTRRQVRLTFETKEEAVAYAEREGIPYVIEEPHERRIQPKAYADNFRYDRIGNWTH
ncbi:MAG TPA: ETC complex I subunit [Candidatus Cybelea sp.]|nr:ETC complex I subunit [Candidatus Cybelea sp.]